MFITFEGGEGSGKTTQIAFLARELSARGLKVLTTREPGGTPLGEHIRDCLLSPNFGISFGSHAELMLFLASRVEHIEKVIKPALAAGNIVLCDRFNDSSVAYQGGARGLGLETVQELCNLACGGFVPDLTFFLDLDPEAGMQRITREHDRLEDAGILFHGKVRQSFLEIASKEPQRVQMIDAHQLPEVVFSSIIQSVDHALAKG